MNRQLLDNLNYATLLSLDEGKSKGSGFLFKYHDKVFLITAKHVLFNEDELRCEKILVSTLDSKGTIHETQIFEIQAKKTQILMSKTDDVAAVLLMTGNKVNLGSINIIQKGIKSPIFIDETLAQKLEHVKIANQVYLIGFPTSLIFEHHKHFDVRKPLLTKGIISGLNVENNTFIIDCSSYYGNSGGAIIEVCDDMELKVIGLVSRYIPFVIEWRNNRETTLSHIEYLNSGYSVCIPIDAVYNLLSSNNI